MNNSVLNLALFAFISGPNMVLANNGSVTITSPANGAVIESYYKTEVKFEASPGSNGDHLHLNVDGKRVDVIHQFKGTVRLDALQPGRHRICLAVNSKSHVPTGAEGCINVASR